MVFEDPVTGLTVGLRDVGAAVGLGDGSEVGGAVDDLGVGTEVGLGEGLIDGGAVGS